MLLYPAQFLHNILILAYKCTDLVGNFCNYLYLHGPFIVCVGAKNVINVHECRHMLYHTDLY